MEKVQNIYECDENIPIDEFLENMQWDLQKGEVDSIFETLLLVGVRRLFDLYIIF